MIGVLLVNLGTPDDPGTPSVRKYLREFLMDGRVIDIPYPFRYLLVNGIIAPFRAPQSAKIYKELWEERGSPLKFYGEDVCASLTEKLGDGYMVRLAMRYQSPDLKSVMSEMQTANLKKLIVIPFFPQYASATTGSVYERVMEIMSDWQIMPSLSMVSYFYQHPIFAKYFADKAANYQKDVDFDYYLFSYHGVPERHIRKGDITKNTCVFGTCCETITEKNHSCYRAQCHETTRLIAAEMGLKPGIVIKLSNEFARSLMQMPSEAYQSNDGLAKHFKGIAIIPENDEFMPGDGGYAVFDLSNVISLAYRAKIMLYYNDTNTFVFGFEGKGFP